MAYSKQTWDTTSYVNPTRMNHIEQGIYDVEQEITTSWSASGDTCTDTTLTVALRKVGRIVFGTISDGYATGSAGDIIAKFPTGFVPNSSIVWDFRDSYSNKRLQISSSGIKTMEAISGNILRGTFMYYVQEKPNGKKQNSKGERQWNAQ